MTGAITCSIREGFPLKFFSQSQDVLIRCKKLLSLRKYQSLCSSRFLETQHSKVHGSVGRTILVQNPKVGSLSAVTSVFVIVWSKLVSVCLVLVLYIIFSITTLSQCWEMYVAEAAVSKTRS